MRLLTAVACIALLAVSGACNEAATQDTSPAGAEDTSLSFFITSVGSGNGGNLGGLEGADAHCQTLAEAAGVGSKTWRAYLSTEGESAINARDRIGSGPWYNAKGVQVAMSVDDLHSANNELSKENSLTENGEMVNGRGDKPNRHDIITGSRLDGTSFSVDHSHEAHDHPAEHRTKAEHDHTCSNWSSNGEDGSAEVGHHDRQGGGQNPTSWNAAHESRGCSQANLEATGGFGLFYCFAAN